MLSPMSLSFTDASPPVESRLRIPWYGWPLLGVLVVGYLDYVTSWELSLFVFYGVPIFLTVWYYDRNAGHLMAVICAATWWIANYTSHPYQTSLGYAWAAVSRFAYFVFVAVGGSALKSHRDADRARIIALERTRQLEQEIVRVGEREQQRIAQDLHDGLCQHLAAIGCVAKSLADDLDAGNVQGARDAREIESLIRDAVVQARNLSHGIAPVQIESSGLATALEELALRSDRYSSVSVTFSQDGARPVPDPVIATHLYRIAQEALANALRHSGAKHITINLDAGSDGLTLSVVDDGTGFAPESVDGDGFGLRTMTYRSSLIGARFDVKSTPGKGTTVSCFILNRPHSND